MIPVKPQPKPAGFDRDVRQKGRRWLRNHGIAPEAAPPDPSKLPPYWRDFNEKLYDAYSGVCSYLAFHFEYVSGTASTDHFVAKSRNAGDAYEWSNYRLACLGANQRKNRYDDVLDPFAVRPDTFELNLANGEMSVNAQLADPQYVQRAQTTITRLDLNSERHKEMRVRHFSQYIRHGDETTLRELNPFVYEEAKRQKFLYENP